MIYGGPFAVPGRFRERWLGQNTAEGPTGEKGVRTAFRVSTALLLCFLLCVFATFSFGQEIGRLKKGVVRITTTTIEGKRKIGTGFIVSLEPDIIFATQELEAVYIVTASHVVEGAREIQVEFFTRRNRLIPVRVLRMQGGDPQGIAVLLVERDIPDLWVLTLNSVMPVRGGDIVTTIGFPRTAAVPWAVIQGNIVGGTGKEIIFSGAVDEGNSGGPLIKEEQVVGIVTEARPPYARAIPAVFAQYTLQNWGVFGISGEEVSVSPPPKHEPLPTPAPPAIRETQLRSRPAALSTTDILQMIQARSFNHAQDLAKYGLSGRVMGNFRHQYELKVLKGDKVVSDHATGLMWQQSGSSKDMTWRKAKGYMTQLNKRHYAGFSDWRLPTVEELTSLLEATPKNGELYIHRAFDPTQRFCWSADRVRILHDMWLVSFVGGSVVHIKGHLRAYVRGVRSRH